MWKLSNSTLSLTSSVCLSLSTAWREASKQVKQTSKMKTSRCNTVQIRGIKLIRSHEPDEWLRGLSAASRPDQPHELHAGHACPGPTCPCSAGDNPEHTTRGTRVYSETDRQHHEPDDQAPWTRCSSLQAISLTPLAQINHTFSYAQAATSLFLAIKGKNHASATAEQPTGAKITEEKKLPLSSFEYHIGRGKKGQLFYFTIAFSFPCEAGTLNPKQCWEAQGDQKPGFLGLGVCPFVTRGNHNLHLSVHLKGSSVLKHLLKHHKALQAWEYFTVALLQNRGRQILSPHGLKGKLVWSPGIHHQTSSLRSATDSQCAFG